MFKNVLIPISSEFYNRDVLRRAVFLAEKFKSSITLVYIIETKTINQTDKLSETYLSDFEISQTKKQRMKEQAITADTIIFEDAKTYFKEKNIKFEKKIARGEFSKTVKLEIEKKDFDLILMGFQKGCILKYNVLEDRKIPLWIEGKSDSRTILAVLSNLMPNKKVLEYSIVLSKKIGWDLHVIYILDTEDSVQVDDQGCRSAKKLERDLLLIGQNFIGKLQEKGIKVELKKGNLQKTIAKTAEKINANLVIIGREQKKKGAMGLPVKNIKKKMAEKCKHSILFLE